MDLNKLDLVYSLPLSVKRSLFLWVVLLKCQLSRLFVFRLQLLFALTFYSKFSLLLSRSFMTNKEELKGELMFYAASQQLKLKANLKTSGEEYLEVHIIDYYRKAHVNGVQ